MAKRPTVPQPKPITNKLVEASRKAAEQEEAPKILSELQAEVGKEAAPLWDFIQNNARLITVAVLALLAAVLIFGLVQWNKDNEIAQAKVELGTIEAVQDPLERLGQLETFLTSAPEAVKVAVYLEMARAANQAADWAKAEQAYTEILNLEQDSPLALTIRLNRSDALLLQGKGVEALADLDYVKEHVGDDVTRDLEELIAETAAQIGQNERAIEAFQACINLIDAASQEDLELVNYYHWRISRLQAN